MPHVAIEAVILTPLLVIQILVFPFVASTISSYWAGEARDMTLQEAASQIGDAIQQLYLAASRIEVTPGTITQASTFPTEIAANQYVARASLKTPLNANSGKFLVLNVTLQNLGNTATAQTSLGSNVLWNEKSVFYSSSPNASIKVQKFANATLLLSFG